MGRANLPAQKRQCMSILSAKVSLVAAQCASNLNQMLSDVGLLIPELFYPLAGMRDTAVMTLPEMLGDSAKRQPRERAGQIHGALTREN